VVSVERETFPQLVASGAKVFGYLENAYWLDIGTPRALLKASIDIVKRSGDFLAMPGSTIDPTAVITGGSCIGPGSTVGAGAHIDGSIIEAGSVIGPNATISDSFVAADAKVENNAKITSSFVTNSEILSIP
jgi:mannose-1-phosphate guanylyltransferase